MIPRIQTLAAGFTREVIAEQTHLFYDPITKSVTVSFQYRPNMYVNDQPMGAGGDWSTLIVGVDELASRLFGEGVVDPVTGKPLNDVSGAGIVMLIKAAFPALYDEAYEAEQDALQAAPESAISTNGEPGSTVT